MIVLVFLTVLSDIIAWACDGSGVTQAVALDIFKAFNRVWYAGLLYKRKSYGISFLSNRRLCVVLDGKYS